MSLLDNVIRAALGSRSSSGSSQLSPIAMALMALLASRMSGGAGGVQGQFGGLGGLLERFKQNGLDSIINSWIGTGQNQPISPTQLRQALGQDTLNDLSEQTGVPHEDLLSQLSQILPGVVDKLTPNGQLPDDHDLLPGPR